MYFEYEKDINLVGAEAECCRLNVCVCLPQIYVLKPIPPVVFGGGLLGNDRVIMRWKEGG